jgi:lipopolysaccharide export system permease protein
MISAADARRNGDTWDLINATFFTIKPPATTTIPRLVWDGSVDVKHIPLLSKDLRELPINDIRNLAVHEGYGQRPTNLYRTWFHHRIASALTPLLMIMLVVSLAHRFHRSSAFTRLMLLSVTIGFGSFIFDNASLAMGEAGFLPPWVAAWSPGIAVVFVIGTFMARAEG